MILRDKLIELLHSELVDVCDDAFVSPENLDEVADKIIKLFTEAIRNLEFTVDKNKTI